MVSGPSENSNAASRILLSRDNSEHAGTRESYRKDKAPPKATAILNLQMPTNFSQDASTKSGKPRLLKIKNITLPFDIKSKNKGEAVMIRDSISSYLARSSLLIEDSRAFKQRGKLARPLNKEQLVVKIDPVPSHTSLI